jgi:hypothetical protein
MTNPYRGLTRAAAIAEGELFELDGTVDGRDCPEMCDHDGACADARRDIALGEAEAERAWLIAAEMPLLNEPTEEEERFYLLRR